MVREEVALAAYLTARVIDRRPVGDEDVRRLRAANASLNETRQRLPHGRGNVREDLTATDGNSRWRAGAARTLARAIDRDRETQRDDYRSQTIHQAASAATFGAGNCGEYSTVSAALHSDRLEPQEELHIVTNGSHQWTEPRIGSDRERTVVIDAWSDGPPVLASDGRFSNTAADRLLNYVPIPNSRRASETRPASTREEMDELESTIRHTLGEDGLRRRIAANARPTARAVALFDDLFGLGIASSPHVVHPDFADRVNRSVSHDRLSAEIAAARVARQLGRPVEAQRSDVQTILGAIDRSLHPRSASRW